MTRWTRVWQSIVLAGVVCVAVTMSGRVSAQVGRSTTVVDANVATEAALSKIPHLTPAVVKALIGQRPFLSIGELDKALTAQGLTRDQIGAVYKQLFIHVNLNTASREEILLVPGVGSRMAHEFEEYRPYRGGLPQFRKEMGKYVDAAEVARLEQYVFVPMNLNTASDDDLMSIPGLGPRMLREFKEYRPYKSIEQFRKEMGKYVDAREVSRLERYVTLQ